MSNRPYLVLVVELLRNDKALAEDVSESLMQRLPSFSRRLRVVALGTDVKPTEVDSSGAASIYRRQGS